MQDFGRIDILVNNAGITKDGLMMRMSEAQWDAVLTVNLKSAFNFIHAVTPIMARQRSGSIINMSSVVGVSGNAGQCNYSASKAGMIGLAKSIAKEMGPRGIRANAIAPGFIITEMTNALPEEVKQGWSKQIPLRRGGTPEDVAEGGSVPCLRPLLLRERTGNSLLWSDELLISAISYKRGRLTRVGFPPFLKTYTYEVEKSTFRFCLALLAGCQKDPDTESTPVRDTDKVEGVIRMKLDRETAEALNVIRTRSGRVLTGNISFDELCERYNVTGMERLFADNGCAERTRKAGLDLWYIIRFEGSAEQVAEDFGEIAGVNHVEIPRRITKVGGMSRKSGTPWRKLMALPKAAPSNYPFNDPLFGGQWPLYNDGTINANAQAGADINVLPAWERRQAAAM